ncbi:hypothetical protein [Variovorax paradoxus]|uniref:hypothetical protein n=1 Tax=Variovorax paradoxus TaxID=34073 RepID=UPI0029C6276F|nr:hypothetical protein [Variovorax paradoxus]WPH18217.1 hypothetical protein RZE78_14360 [Variovorax paradoxus]
MSVYIGDEDSTLSLVGKGLEAALAAKLRKQLSETVLEPMVKEAVKDLIDHFQTYRRIDRDSVEIHVSLKRGTATL